MSVIGRSSAAANVEPLPLRRALDGTFDGAVRQSMENGGMVAPRDASGTLAVPGGQVPPGAVASRAQGEGLLVQPYTVHLPGFEGPLDLLLHLIERNQLEITTISLVAVTDQFIQYLRTWDEPPMPRLAEFVAMAARLLLIKSRSLLPRQLRHEPTDDETDPFEDAEKLRLHLIEYQRAREIARALRARELAGLQSFARAGRLIDPEALLTWAPPQLVGLNVQALSLVFRRVLTEKRLAEPEQLPLPLVTVAEKIAEVEALLAAQGRASFADVLRTAGSRFAVVVTFLAVLEMWHQARLIVTQDGLFGPIELLPGPRFSLSATRGAIDVGPIAPPDATQDADESAEGAAVPEPVAHATSRRRRSPSLSSLRAQA